MIDQKPQLIEPANKSISVRRQCELIGLPRASLYYEPQPESLENLLLIRLIDEQFTRPPFYGVLKMTAWLREVMKCEVNFKRVRRLMRLMGLEATNPKLLFSLLALGLEAYPHLRHGLKIDRVN
ncbi:MAG: transposase, partial [Acidobacteria bacterium]|nr:transposase [Acidobacteriota bacterium]